MGWGGTNRPVTEPITFTEAEVNDEADRLALDAVLADLERIKQFLLGLVVR